MTNHAFIDVFVKGLDSAEIAIIEFQLRPWRYGRSSGVAIKISWRPISFGRS